MDNPRFLSAVAILPGVFRQSALRLPEVQQQLCEEIRLRVGQPMMFQWGGTEYPSDSPFVESRDLQLILELATRSSLHSAIDSLREGFIPMQGGHRLGVCGSIHSHSAMQRFTSLNLRIARDCPTAGETVYPALYAAAQIPGVLLLSPPGAGKTTLLRDLIRRLSMDGKRVSVADEREEISAPFEGGFGFDLGPHTDVITGAQKSEAMLQLLRTMNPQVLAADEITSPGDMNALEKAVGCGVSLLVTVHGSGLQEILRRPAMENLVHRGAFSRLVTIRSIDGVRRYQVTPI